MAQSKVQPTQISRRGLLKKATGLVGLSVSLAGVAMIDPALAAVPKYSHRKAKYQYQPRNGDQCSTCRFFVSPSSCKIVQSPISPDGWCEFYAAKPKG